MSGSRDAESAAQLTLLMKIVEQEVNRLSTRMPARTVEREELVGCAMVGLCEARARFKPEHGVPLGAYARLRIRGSLIDGMRNSLGLVRRRYFETFQRQQVNATTPQSLQQHLNHLKREIMSDYRRGSASQCPEQLMIDKERAVSLHTAISGLDHEKRVLICRLFGLEVEQDSGESLAQQLGCHRSSISRRKHKILGELRTLLSDDAESAAASVQAVTAKRPERQRFGGLGGARKNSACPSPPLSKRRRDRHEALNQGKIPRSL